MPIADYKRTRVKFWKMVTDLFSTAYMKQIYEWCDERGLKLTGHLVLEETLESQLITNGACMPHYEYLHIPGMDWLGRNIYECLTPMQVSSVCEQLGKKQVLSETFALCGHNVSFSELKGIYEWQMVHGINLLCQHLEGYSIRGIRKRDYPPAMYYQQPWWSEYDKFNEALSREGMILSMGEKKADVLVIHPQTTAWTYYDDGENRGLSELNDELLKTVRRLEEKHILYHFGDETIMERHAYAKDGKLVIGNQSYSYILCEQCEVLFENTRRLLDEFVKSGGRIVTVDDLKADTIVDNTRITYTRRSFEACRVHYFVNTSANYEKAEFQVAGKMLDIFTGELRSFSGSHEFEPWGSLMIVEDGTENEKGEEIPQTLIRPEGIFKIIEPVQNLLTLDQCDYYFDDELQEKDGYVLNICERANALERAVKIHQDYHVTADYVPEKLYLVCETPGIFTITVNGKIIDKTAEGYFIDKLKKAVNELMWDERNGFYYSVDLNLKPINPNSRYHNGCPRNWNSVIQKIDVWSGFLTMWSGIASEERAARMVLENMKNEKVFCASFGVRTLGKNEQMYQIVKSGNPSCWLGPVWGIANYLCFRGLVKYGFVEQAEWLAKVTIDLFGKDIEENGEMHEYYDPDSGAGVNNSGFQSWNLLVNNMIAWVEGRKCIEEF